MPNAGGFTLWELLQGLLLAALLLGLGVPALHSLVLDTRLTADVNAFVAAARLARSETAKRGGNIIMCNSADGIRCGPGGALFDTGWVVRPELASGMAGAGSAPALASYRPVLEGTIRANRNEFVFRPFPRRSTNGTVMFCDERGATAGRAVVVSYTGRARVVDPGQGRIVCPQ